MGKGLRFGAFELRDFPAKPSSCSLFPSHLPSSLDAHRYFEAAGSRVHSNSFLSDTFTEGRQDFIVVARVTETETHENTLRAQ